MTQRSQAIQAVFERAGGVDDVNDPNGRDDSAMLDLSVELAQLLMQQASRHATAVQRRREDQLARLMRDRQGKNFTLALVDRLLNSSDLRRAARSFQACLHRFGVPAYLPAWQRLAISLAGLVSRFCPGLVIPQVVAHMRRESSDVIVDAEPRAFSAYIHQRRSQGFRLNINSLGEAILGEEEAEQRLLAYERLLQRDEIDYVSVKISSVSSQLSVAAFEKTVEHIAERLRRLLRKADKRVFLNLDMEEYRDLSLTVAAFKKVLDEDEFLQYAAGFALQTYLPDATDVFTELQDWARRRCDRGGVPIKVRLVKGANLAMERVESAQHGWAQAPLADKVSVDAHYKQLLRQALTAESCAAIRIGVASHNVFDLAYALLLRHKHQVADSVEIEMLEGMAGAMADQIAALAGGVLVYAPAVEQEHFRSAIAYLVRRLDENTQAGNFLADSFGMQPGSDAWRRQEIAFRAAWQRAQELDCHGRYRQVLAKNDPAQFRNEPELDFCDPHTRLCVEEALERRAHQSEHIPLVIAGDQLRTGEALVGQDPSRPQAKAYQYHLATWEQVDVALTAAQAALSDWQGLGSAGRRARLMAVAQCMRQRRHELIAAAVQDGGKTAVEADPEIAEAIDFADYYARAFDGPEHAGISWRARGVVVVAPPWNFPVSIPAGGVLAALMAGNSVILKPAPEAVLAAWAFACCVWDAGIDAAVLQFVPCADDPVGTRLIKDPRVDVVVLTGASATARMMAAWRPDLRLIAETGGKNALVISAAADRDLAIKDLVAAAFGHAGQKCSAASLAICQAGIYDDEDFRRQLRDAAASLPVGSGWDAWHRVTPLIRPPTGPLLRALTQLDAGEEWLLQPKQLDAAGHLWSPGIKLGVQAGGFFHTHECFGPVLGLMRVRSLEEAIALQNHSSYGLTGGLHSLDEREQERWVEQVEVGNAYINRSITGAIVQRQAFGGWKDSCFGPGAKAGGPHYVWQLASAKQVAMPADEPDAMLVDRLRERYQEVLTSVQQTSLALMLASYQQAWEGYFSQWHDPSHVLGELNILRFRPLPSCLLRVAGSDALLVAAAVQEACRLVGTKLVISISPLAVAGHEQGLRQLGWHCEDRLRCCERLAGLPKGSRLRLVGGAHTECRQAAVAAQVAVVDDDVLAQGRLELRHYLREQSLSHRYHRYGNLSLGSPLMRHLRKRRSTTWLGQE